ncbi:94eff651-eae6-4404-b1e0-a5e80ac42da2 [Thermothielavioides terrestris]|uniref:94eff651-eae6-4404-b1e0-a5e80ac42da2 n=1 Tax=Thermothielavioides terrestris TaxID=2587410 RepID=A0A446BT23_9PEZI|nr:94eff651-eae6-4404-b1e0-a5e80ac42da2 [Thermothielavioides terrestris]
MAFFGPGCACRGPLKRYCRSKDGCAGFQYNESVLCSGCPLDAKKCKNPKRCARIHQLEKTTASIA